MIDEEQIRAVATDAAYKRGVRYFSRGAVGHLERQEDGRSYTAVVEGTEAYHVRISLTEAGDENRVDLLQVISSLEDECENLENVAGNVETNGWQNDKEYNISNTQTL